MRILLITGLPGTGKSTLARQLAQRYRVAVLAKDAVKEPLLDAFGPCDAARSRELSNVSFAVLFSLARELAAGGTDFILEGNLRRGEHEQHLRELPASRMAQVLCTADEAERRARLAARRLDVSRHPEHADAERVDSRVAADCLLDLPAECIVVDGAGSDAMERIDRWWNAAA